MRTKFFSIVSLLIVCVFLVEPAVGQRNPYKRRKGGNKKVSSYRGKSVGGKFRPYEYLRYGINAMNYYGDLAPISSAGRTDVSFTRPGTGITYGLRLHPSFAVSANYNFGRVKGADFSTANRAEVSEDQYPRFTRNLSFRNDIHEINVGGKFYFLADNNSPTYSRPINGYIYIGVGAFIHDPKGQIPLYDYQTYGPNAAGEGAPTLDQDPEFAEALAELGVAPGDWVKLRTLNTEGQGREGRAAPYKPFQWQIPINTGVEVHIPRTLFKIGVEFGFRYLFTDYLDDVSTSYAGLDTFENPIARIMSDRGAEPVFEDFDRQAVAEAAGYSLGIVQNNFGDQSYYIAGNVGSGIEDARRGNPEANDFYFITQLNIKFILPPNGLFKSSNKARAKFR
jgi:hypothetical protein